ncbi:MAG: ABC transporter permease [Spirochaetaceae bacterium]|nr:ABC transporter permease [Spirochaetaceae bacterium]
MHESRPVRMLFGSGSIVFALLLTSLVLLATGTNPVAAYSNILQGAFGSADVAANVIVSWVPLMLVTSGLLVTFTVGLWNIGIEGQITLGAIFTVWAERELANAGLPPGLVIALAMLAGAAGGALWAMLAGVLKAFGGVNEIFGGLGLNFVATALNLWLIFGPWKRPGIASMSGTLPFDPSLWMPTITPQSRLAIIPVIIALVGIVFVFILLKGSYFGLQLKAVGKNPRAAYILGIPTWQRMMTAFALCGAFAGLAGGVQVTAVYHRLIPSISSGYGYSGLLVAMLANYSAIASVPVALFFAALNVGSIQLPIVLKLDSSLAGVIQGFLVLFVLLGNGIRTRIFGRQDSHGARPARSKRSKSGRQCEGDDHE